MTKDDKNGQKTQKKSFEESIENVCRIFCDDEVIEKEVINDLKFIVEDYFANNSGNSLQGNDCSYPEILFEADEDEFNLFDEKYFT